jgi:hypothetical protein
MFSNSRLARARRHRASRILSRCRDNDVYRSWSYNAAGQLSSQYREIIGSQADPYAWTRHYAVNRNYTTNGLNQYSAAGLRTLGYDANGNLTQDGPLTYVYDIENRLVSSSTGAALVYDSLGRLFQVSRTVAGVTSTPKQPRRFRNRTRITHPDGFSSATAYDGLNRPNYFDANGAGQIYAYYLPHGGYQGVGRPNGTSSGYAYDALQGLQGRVEHSSALQRAGTEAPA